ncbi:MAG TPA: ATP-binding protein, partial [Spirochaetales bacterium]|nr:ATP-binding protein [Spirochaetales bacterium]
FSVSDDGAGFRTVYRGHGEPPPAGKNKGIGMDLVEALAAQLGGRMERGSPPAGAVTTVRFPVRDAAQDR